MNLDGLVSLLDEDNVTQLKKNIVMLITDRVRSDLDNYSNYVLYPPDMQYVINDAIESTQKKVEKMYKDAVIDINLDYISKLKEYMSRQADDPDKKIRREIIELAKKLKYDNQEYGRNKRIATKLEEIAGEGI